MLEKFAIFKVFKSFLSTQEAESVRSIAKKANVSPSSSKSCIDYLKNNGIITDSSKGRTFELKLNNRSVLTNHIKICFSLSEIEKSGIITELTSKHPEISSITLYGSCATGKDNMNSDIDLLIISNKKIKKGLLEKEKLLKRELSILSLTFTQWKARSSEEKPFYENIIIDGIVLHGELPVVR